MTTYNHRNLFHVHPLYCSLAIPLGCLCYLPTCCSRIYYRSNSGQLLPQEWALVNALIQQNEGRGLCSRLPPSCCMMPPLRNYFQMLYFGHSNTTLCFCCFVHLAKNYCKIPEISSGRLKHKVWKNWTELTLRWSGEDCLKSTCIHCAITALTMRRAAPAGPPICTLHQLSQHSTHTPEP